MTTTINTSNPTAVGTPSAAPSTAQLNALPGRSSVGNRSPEDAQLRTIPAGLAGATGASPQDLLLPPDSGSAESLYYVAESARTTTPQVLPVLNLAPPGFEPPLGFIVPSSATAADPRGLPGRTAPPGQHLGSTAPATPGVELGSQAFVPRVPPTSAFGQPTEESLRGAPAAAAGAGGISPQPLVALTATGDSRPYFLESVPRASPRTGPGSEPRIGVPSGEGAALYFLREIGSPTASAPAPEPGAVGFRPEVVAGEDPRSA